MGVFVRDHGKDQHGKEQDELAELCQVTVPRLEGDEG
jgi:hypothetical protein